MTEGQTSARMLRADEPAAPALRLPWSVCAVAHGDWLIFLDLAHNRYRAVALATVSDVTTFRSVDIEPLALNPHRREALTRDGLVTISTREHQPSPLRHGQQADWWDLLAVLASAVWARGIVRRGALIEAFARLSGAKALLDKVAPNADEAALVYARFAAARNWVPAAYVCLFDSLTLMRFALARGVRADLVFGVRSRPFAAHCWVEVDGIILDDGGEECRSFAEIVRV